MKIFSVQCAEGCKTQHLTASHRAAAASAAHETSTGHLTSTSESEVLP